MLSLGFWLSSHSVFMGGFGKIQHCAATTTTLLPVFSQRDLLKLHHGWWTLFDDVHNKMQTFYLEDLTPLLASSATPLLPVLWPHSLPSVPRLVCSRAFQLAWRVLSEYSHMADCFLPWKYLCKCHLLQQTWPSSFPAILYHIVLLSFHCSTYHHMAFFLCLLDVPHGNHCNVRNPILLNTAFPIPGTQ